MEQLARVVPMEEQGRRLEREPTNGWQRLRREPKHWSTAGRVTPATSCPRERLLVSGASTLGDVELLALLIGKGRPNERAMEQAQRLVDFRAELSQLARMSAPELSFFGLKEGTAVQLLASFELVRRILAEPLTERSPMNQPGEVARFLWHRYERVDQEAFGVLLLDSRNRLIGVQELFRGTLSRAAAEPRQIIRQAILSGAGAVILFHNHPSGSPVPSADDFAFNRRVVDALDTVGVRVIDHLVLAGPDRWTSLRERRPW